MATSADSKLTPGLCVYIAIGEDFEDYLLDVAGKDECRRITRDTFQKHWNESFETLQKARLQGGEYYIERAASGSHFTFHAFLREPSRHYEVTCWQDVEYAQFQIEMENCITYRRGIANHNPVIPNQMILNWLVHNQLSLKPLWCNMSDHNQMILQRMIVYLLVSAIISYMYLLDLFFIASINYPFLHLQ